MRAALGLNSLATIEFMLWEGQAHDALESLRIAIKTFNYNFQFKTDHVFGQGPNTRAQAFLQELSAGKVSAADKYRTARAALIALGLPQDDPTLQPLSNDQLWAKDSSKPSRLGDTKKEDPWFWTVGRPAGLSPKEEQEWSLESMLIFKLPSYLTKFIVVDRVKWFRDRAARDRSQEEKEILEEEFARSERSFQRMQEVWTILAEGQSHQGYKCYAYKQATMYERLLTDCQTLCKKALAKGKLVLGEQEA